MKCAVRLKRATCKDTVGLTVLMRLGSAWPAAAARGSELHVNPGTDWVCWDAAAAALAAACQALHDARVQALELLHLFCAMAETIAKA